jgi:histidine triad (HIT) family protein
MRKLILGEVEDFAVQIATEHLGIPATQVDFYSYPRDLALYNEGMDKCIFCQIAARQSPANIYFEDDNCMAFPNLSPIVNGHVMVIPKRHAENMLDIDTEALKAMAVSTQEVARKVVLDYKATGFNLLMANGKDAQQSVFHFHWHIIPRHPDDGLDLWIKQGL